MVIRDELEQLVRYELIQRREEGYDVAEIENVLFERKKMGIAELEDFLNRLERSAFRSDFHYTEPSDLKEIEAERAKEPERIEVTLSDSMLYDKIYGGWLGRCAGCLLGQPMECMKKEQIEEALKKADAYPLRSYFPPILAPGKGGGYGRLLGEGPEWLLELARRLEQDKRISRMARDDDIDFTIMNLHILETYGSNVTTMNIGESWLYLMPYRNVFTAERIAYRNLIDGIPPPKSATYKNPFREWVGAQIRADIWGYVSPGMPELGVELAYRDAMLSHVKNGIYGEMFVSAMISAAIATNKVEKIIETGLSVIPKDSRLAEAVKDVIAWSREYNSWEDAWLKVIEKYGHYDPTHTINNAAIVLLGLIYGEGDYERSITISVMGGLDTDCNGATTGSILGVMLGAEALPDKWVKPLNDRVESFVIGYYDSRISKLARRTLRLTRRFSKDK